METIHKNDFIEIEFTGKSNNEIFDTTNKEEAKQLGLEIDVKPMIVSAGNQMLLKGLDESLEGKEIGKKYSVHLTPEQAFGKRHPELIKTIPFKIFKEKNINPYPGMALQLDNSIAKVLSVSGGRIIVDFNNPMAGKEIEYDFTAKRKIADDAEKINALQDFFFRQRFEFEVKEENGNKKVIFKKQEIKPFIDMLKQKFKDITGLNFEVEEAKEEKISHNKNNETFPNF